MFSTLIEDMVFHYQGSTGTIGLWIHGKRVKRINPNDLHGGSRQFFKYGAYFIKAEYWSEESNGFSQCSQEAYMHYRIEAQDKKFFTPMLACSEFERDTVHWTVFPWYSLVTEADKHAIPIGAAKRKVERLCEKYGIYDVYPYYNNNWFIHNNTPLIVDCGILRDEVS